VTTLLSARDACSVKAKLKIGFDPHSRGSDDFSHNPNNGVSDGQQVSSLCRHLQCGSFNVPTSYTIKTGEIVGVVRRTGASCGPHLYISTLTGGTVSTDSLTHLKAKTDS
jgi:hypothetical protein